MPYVFIFFRANAYSSRRSRIQLANEASLRRAASLYFAKN